ncbi:CHAT domain-containing protein [Nocardia sp. NPDC052566]|uniref:CHAT domain-containing protein n=1 Tax=Nocardia sp. NPDC052566 TaxID=3364330 RepID=UPI0037C9806A
MRPHRPGFGRGVRLLLLGRYHWLIFRITKAPVRRAKAETLFAQCVPAVGFAVIPAAAVPDIAATCAEQAANLLDRALRSGDVACLDAAIASWSRVSALDAPPHERSRRLSELSYALLSRYWWLSDKADLDAAATAAEAAMADHGDDRALHMVRLGEVWYARWSTLDDESAVDECVRWGLAAGQIAIPDSPLATEILLGIGGSYTARYSTSGMLDDLDEAVRILRTAVARTPDDHVLWPDAMSNLGATLAMRFAHTGQSEDLSRSVEFARTAIAATPADHPMRPLRLLGLTMALEQSGLSDHRDCAIDNYRYLASVVAQRHYLRPRLMQSFGDLLIARFTAQGAQADLVESVAVYRAAAACSRGEAARSTALADLSNALRLQYEISGDTADLDESITHARSALRLDGGGDHHRAESTMTLGTALWRHFERSGDQSALTEAVELHSAAVSLTNPGAAAVVVGTRLTNLAMVLLTRYESAGDTADLDRAVDTARSAVAAEEPDSVSAATTRLNLATGLIARFHRRGDAGDLSEAAGFLREAVAATPADHAQRAVAMTTLGIALAALHEQHGDPALLDEAIDWCRTAVAAVAADAPQRAACLSNLGTILTTRFDLRADSDDLDAALRALADSLAATPPGHPDRPLRLSNLAMAQLSAYATTGTAEMLDLAVDSGTRAVDTCPPGHDNRTLYLANLSTSLRLRFEDSGDPADLDAAIDATEAVLDSEQSSPRRRIDAAIELGRWLVDVRLSDATELLAKAVDLMPNVASRHLGRRERLALLRNYSQLATDTAALLLRDTGLAAAGHAVSVLETGRTVLWGQAMETRAATAELRTVAPELADRFENLREQVDIDADSAPMLPLPDLARHDADRRHRTAEQFHRTLSEIRAMPGFADFLRPSEIHVLRAQSAAGPIVLLNASTYGCHALIVRPDRIVGIRLRRAELQPIEQVVPHFHTALDTALRADTPRTDRVRATRTIRESLTFLWRAAVRPVLAELGYLGNPNPAQPQRLWWIPTGAFSALPLHAAGDYTTPDGPTTTDYVVSSYAPSIRHLRYAREHLTTPGTHTIAAIAMPSTPARTADGIIPVGRLRNAEPETTFLRRHYPNASSAQDYLTGAAATLNPVTTALNRCSIAHFACHADSHPIDPSQSRILLHDHNTTPLTLLRLAALELPHAQLAYLSACRTAHSLVADFLDESLNLAAACMVAGYPRVVATQWSVPDHLALQVAEHFYRNLSAPSADPDPARAAFALHRALRELRAESDLRRSPHLWAAWVHVGI